MERNGEKWRAMEGDGGPKTCPRALLVAQSGLAANRGRRCVHPRLHPRCKSLPLPRSCPPQIHSHYCPLPPISPRPHRRRETSCRIQAPTRTTVCCQTIEIAVTGRPLLARHSTRHPGPFKFSAKISLPTCASVVPPPPSPSLPLHHHPVLKRHTQATPGAFHRSLSQNGKTLRPEWRKPSRAVAHPDWPLLFPTRLCSPANLGTTDHVPSDTASVAPRIASALLHSSEHAVIKSGKAISPRHARQRRG